MRFTRRLHLQISQTTNILTKQALTTLSEPDQGLQSSLTSTRNQTICFRQHKVFDEIPQKNIISWNALLIAYSIHNKSFETLKLFSQLVSCSGALDFKPDNFTINCVLKALFDGAPKKEIVSRNSMVAGYSQSGMYAECLEMYRENLASAGFRPNGVTVASVLLACAQFKDLEPGIEVISSRAVWNSIIGMYAKCGNLDYARKLFENMKEKDEVSYGAMISGYMIHGFSTKAIELLEIWLFKIKENGCVSGFDL